MKTEVGTVGALLLAGLAAFAVHGQSTQGSVHEPSDDEIRRLLIQRSIAAYSGACPCPDSRNASGNRCGGSSAYSRDGGERPLCYPSDVTEKMISRHREELAKW